MAFSADSLRYAPLRVSAWMITSVGSSVLYIVGRRGPLLESSVPALAAVREHMGNVPYSLLFGVAGAKLGELATRRILPEGSQTRMHIITGAALGGAALAGFFNALVETTWGHNVLANLPEPPSWAVGYLPGISFLGPEGDPGNTSGVDLLTGIATGMTTSSMVYTGVSAPATSEQVSLISSADPPAGTPTN